MILELYQVCSRFVRHHWLTLAFVLGFIVDNLTLTRVDQVFDNVVILTYIILAMLSIIALYTGMSERYGEGVNRFLRKYAPMVMQYAFGGLLSGILIFYGRSGSLVNSWPFLLIILAVIYGNETIKLRGQRLVYNLTIFFVGLFSYIVLIVPVLLSKMGPWIFVGSGLIALFIMYIFFNLLERVVPNFVHLQKRSVVFFIGIVYILLNVFYFTNLIPPIPLSLKHIGIYHSVTKESNNTYSLVYEKQKWWRWYKESDTDFHYSTGDDVYCFASVFAPARLNTEIVYRWEYYDEKADIWIQQALLPYTIVGGRGGGYRSYTKVGVFKEGEWRCTVETSRGQVLGKETFTIASGVKRELVTKVE